jgi:drug/metabolite transporter (DMT)-like permease
MRALDYGPAGLTSLFTNMNIVLVIGLATWWYGERLAPFQWAGIVLLLLAVMFVSIRPGESLSLRERTWFSLIAVSILLFTLRNGGLKVTGELALNAAAVLLIGYLLSLLWFAGTIWNARRDTASEAQKKQAARGLGWGLLAGICSYGGLQCYALALTIGPANIIAPMFAANSLVIALGAVWLFNERLTRLQWLAVFFLCCGLALVRT